MKRLFDIIFAALGIIILSPFIALGALAVELSSPGSVFFCQKRVGRRGRIFTLYKLRTMKVENGGLSLVYQQDKRIFPVGRILRRTKIDELPQLINVLVGDMSFVGPRPELPAFVFYYKPHWLSVLDFRPGITGIGSLLFRNEEDLFLTNQDMQSWYINEILPCKMELELGYLKQASLLLDLRLITLTLLSLYSRSSILPLKYFTRPWESSLMGSKAKGSRDSSAQAKSKSDKA